MKFQIVFVLLLATVLHSANGDLVNKGLDIGSKIKLDVLSQNDLFVLINNTVNALNDAFNSENGIQAKKDLKKIFSLLSVKIANDPELANLAKSKAIRELTKNLLKINNDFKQASLTSSLGKATEVLDVLLNGLLGLLSGLLTNLNNVLEEVLSLVTNLLDALSSALS